MKAPLSLGASVAALLVTAPTLAQDHSGHVEAENATSARSPDAPGPGQHQVDRSKMGRDSNAPTSVPMAPAGPAMDHAAMDHAAMGHSAATRPEAIGTGSGTSRLPAHEGMPTGLHVPVGEDGMVMLHGYSWGVYTKQTGPRGDDKLYVQSMAMAEYQHRSEGARLSVRGMLSLEPAMRHDGYPNLFATGEVAYGQPLVDRQHPHDLFMELSGRLDIDIAENTTAFLYGGPVGEPALGPSAFMHRASARYNPEAPITHHWFDSTHIVYGVITAGIAAPKWQVEWSAFRGREPDEFRWNIEAPKLDSWSVRASFAPSPSWLLQASYGQITDPEELHPGDEHRTTVSAHYNNGRGFSAMAAFSAKDRVPGDTLTAWLAEANWDITKRHTLFGRFENVANDELFPDHLSPLHDQLFRVSKLQVGYAYRIPLGPLELGVGGSIAGFIKPAALDAYYGRNPVGYTVFARLSLGG